MKTVARGQHVGTLDEAELAKFGWFMSRVHLSTRKDGSVETRRSVQYWRKTVSHHQGRHGIEVGIDSLFGDVSLSWFYDGGLIEQIPKGNVNQEACCQSKTETNIIDDVIVPESRDTISLAKKDRGRTRDYDQNFFELSFDEDDQISST